MAERKKPNCTDCPPGWHNCSAEEKYVRSRGAKVVGYRLVALADIDIAGSERTNPRLGDGGLVYQRNIDAYAEAMQAPEPDFPACVLMETAKGKGAYSILGGLTRTKAREAAGFTDVYALILEEMDEAKARLLRSGLNNFNGEKESEDSSLRVGVELVTRFKHDPRIVATDLGVKIELLNSSIRISEFCREAEKHGIYIDTVKCAKKSLEYATRIKSPTVLLAMAQLLSDYPAVLALDVEACTQEIARHAKKKKLDDGPGLAAVESLRSQCEKRPPSRKRKSVGSRSQTTLFCALRDLQTASRNTPSLAGLAPKEIVEFGEMWNEVRTLVCRIIDGQNGG